MIDIHSHVIYGVDDGPTCLEDSLALLKESYAQGVRTIVATSHRRKGLFETAEETIYQHFLEVKAAAQEALPDLQLFYGAELFYTRDMLDKLITGQVPFLGESQIALIEFSSVIPFQEMRKAVLDMLMLGFRPVIAHIERYESLAFDSDRVQTLRDMGCYTQVNSVHVFKPKLFGDRNKIYKKRVAYFLKENLVDCVASDMHSLDIRPPYMAVAYQLIANIYGEQRAERLFITCPNQILNNDKNVLLSKSDSNKNF